MPSCMGGILSARALRLGCRSMATEADILVIFGITGDLAQKMTFRALYRLEVRRELDCRRILGVARNKWDREELDQHAGRAIEAQVPDPDEEAIKRLDERLEFVQGEFDEPELYQRLAKDMGEFEQAVFYLEIPPSLFGIVVRGLHEVGLTERARVVLEKPFGHDRASAQALNAELCEVLSEEQILRIDHFLGKEPVMDITYLRFANAVLEPVWNHRYVDSIRITMAEDFGVDDRGSFYDAVGALRDVVQNHLMQMLALVAMEPPSAGGDDADAIRDRKADLFRAMPSADPSRYVRGQYRGYREVEGVAPDSRTETFVALRLEVEDWRWWKVPVFIRAGKQLPVEATEVRIVFKRPPRLGIGGRMIPDPDEFVIRVKPEPGAELCLMAKKSGEDALHRVHLDMLFGEQDADQPEAYERLLRDALRGDPQLFPTFDTIDQTWRIVQPLLDDPPPVEIYEPGTWGPESASHLLTGHGGWRQPWLPGEPNNSAPRPPLPLESIVRGYAADIFFCFRVRACAVASGPGRRELFVKQQRGPDRAAEVAELGDVHRGRPLVDEQVLVHLLGDLLDVGLAEADPEPAADDHRLDVEQVDRRPDAGAERLQGAVDELLGHRVAVLERPLPDPAGEPVAAVLLHDLEQLRLRPIGVLAPRPRLHRPAPGVGLHAAAAAAGAAGAAANDHHVPDLARRAAPDPALAVEDQAAADPGAPEDAEDRLVRLPGAELELGVGGDVDVVADPHLRAERVGERPPEREAPLPAGQVARLGDVAGCLVGVARRADPDPGERVGLHPGGVRRLDHRLGHLRGDVRGSARRSGSPAAPRR